MATLSKKYKCRTCHEEKLDIYFVDWRDIVPSTGMYPKAHHSGRHPQCKVCHGIAQKQSNLKHGRVKRHFSRIAFIREATKSA